MSATLRTRLGLTLATLLLLLFCGWTASLLLSIDRERQALRQRVDALDAVERIQDTMARSAAGVEPGPGLWEQRLQRLERSADRLVPAGCGPRLTGAFQRALVELDGPAPTLVPEERAHLADVLLELTGALRAENAALSRTLEDHVGDLFAVALGAIVLAMTTLVTSWWVLRTRERIERMGERIARQARVDYLTGVWNRRMVIGLLERELARSARLGLSVSVVMYDLDHFKRINDTLGHAAGDRALVEVSAAVSGLLRGYDLLGRIGEEDAPAGTSTASDELVGRYGGEEFLVVLPGHDLADGRLVAERLRQAIEGLDTFAEQGRRITASFGVAASMAGAAVDAHALIDAADSALYRAKEQGRNQVAVHERPLEGPIWS
jgi:GGDEF domain-containing protein